MMLTRDVAAASGSISSFADRWSFLAAQVVLGERSDRQALDQSGVESVADALASYVTE